MADEKTRLRLEMIVEDKASAVDLTPNGVEWLDTPEWEAFTRACVDLLHYFEAEGETVIGPLGLGGYAGFPRLLRKALLSGELDPQQYDRVEDELIFLENWIDDVRAVTMTNLRYHHPELGI